MSIVNDFPAIAKRLHELSVDQTQSDTAQEECEPVSQPSETPLHVLYERYLEATDDLSGWMEC
jgi:hypothetical protein